MSKLKEELKKILKKSQIFPKKRLGQHFLVSKKALEKIIEAISPQGEIILEIGAGTGILTKELAKKAKKVIAIEKDPKLFEILKENLKNFKNVQIIKGDARKIGERMAKKLPYFNYKIVGNLPFYLSGFLLRKFLEIENPPKEIIFVFQKELAQKITAHAPKSNLLAICAQFYSQPKIVATFPENIFWPKPKVKTSILKFKMKKLSKFKKNLKFKKAFFLLIKAGFCEPRKKLLNNLRKKLGLKKEIVQKMLKNAKIKESARSENLTLKDWFNLTKIFLENEKKFS